MLNKLLIVLLNTQEKVWLKELDYLIFYCDKTEQKKEKLLILEDKLKNLINFRKLLGVK